MPKHAKQVAALVAVATIHEDSFSLDDLTFEELEKLRERVSFAIQKRLSKSVPFVSFDFCPADDRSYGSLEFVAQTVHGEFYFKNGRVDQAGEIEDQKVYLWPTGKGEDFEVDLDSFEFDSRFHMDMTGPEAEAVVAKAILAWAADYDDGS